MIHWISRRSATYLVLGALLSPASCTTRSDPGYNPYAPSVAGRTVLQAADGAVDALEDTLDELDVRLENAVY